MASDQEDVGGFWCGTEDSTLQGSEEVQNQMAAAQMIPVFLPQVGVPLSGMPAQGLPGQMMPVMSVPVAWGGSNTQGEACLAWVTPMQGLPGIPLQYPQQQEPSQHAALQSSQQQSLPPLPLQPVQQQKLQHQSPQSQSQLHDQHDQGDMAQQVQQPQMHQQELMQQLQNLQLQTLAQQQSVVQQHQLQRQQQQPLHQQQMQQQMQQPLQPQQQNLSQALSQQQQQLQQLQHLQQQQQHQLQQLQLQQLQQQQQHKLAMTPPPPQLQGDTTQLSRQQPQLPQLTQHQLFQLSQQLQLQQQLTQQLQQTQQHPQTAFLLEQQMLLQQMLQQQQPCQQSHSPQTPQMFSPLSSCHRDAILSRPQGPPNSCDNWHNCPERRTLQSQQEVTGQAHDSSLSGWGYSENPGSHYAAPQEEVTSDWHSHNSSPPQPHWNSPGNTRRDRCSSGTPNVPSENQSGTLDKTFGGKSRNSQYFPGTGGQQQHFEGTEQSQQWATHGSKSRGGGSDRGGKGRGHGAGWLGSPRRFSRRDSGQQSPNAGKGAGPDGDSALYSSTELHAGTGEAPPHQNSGERQHTQLSNRRDDGPSFSGMSSSNSASQGIGTAQGPGDGSGLRKNIETRRNMRGVASPMSPPYGGNSPQMPPYYCRGADSSMSPSFSSTPLSTPPYSKGCVESPMAPLTPTTPMTPLGSPPTSTRGRQNNIVSGNPHAADTMKAQLQALQLEDPATVFIARRINKLGFSSADHLRTYFSRYGEVKDVYVSHSRVKSLRPLGERRVPNDAHWRLRAAALGFLVMVSAEARAQILREGPEHIINSVAVRVHSFHRRSFAEVSDAEDADKSAAVRGGYQKDSIEDVSASEVTALYKSYAMGGGAMLHNMHARDEGEPDEPEEVAPVR